MLISASLAGSPQRCGLMGELAGLCNSVFKFEIALLLGVQPEGPNGSFTTIALLFSRSPEFVMPSIILRQGNRRVICWARARKQGHQRVFLPTSGDAYLPMCRLEAWQSPKRLPQPVARERLHKYVHGVLNAGAPELP
jgi:hypothetical protein